MIGKELGHFRITAAIGAGGMGEVYRARDERLGRDVAIKVLPPGVAGDPDRLARFEREARALAHLSHPNILTIHDFGREGGISFAVTELLDGETLRVVIERGAVEWRKAAEIAASIADGLAAAHEGGVVHRDLKPENVIITTDGRVKILDFGLARMETDAATAAEALTEAGGATMPGVVLGTVGYMAPEQVRGEKAAAPADIFALGCILYELLSGSRAFSRQTNADVLAAILTQPPDPLPARVPPLPRSLGAIVERCLQKHPDDRFQSARDVASALRSSLAPAAEGAQDGAGATGLPARDRPSVAVLPFANLSADPEQEFFCDGMAEEIINALAQIKDLRVVARTSAFAFKGKQEDVRTIGRSLAVGAIVEGSVRKAGDRLRIMAQLIDARDGSHLWSERYDRRMSDVFEIQDEISLAIVEKLEVNLLGAERAAVVRRSTANIDAYSAYLRGIHYVFALTPEGYRRGLECLEEAIRIDPGYARAHFGLAVWHLSQSWFAELAPRDGLAVAVPLAERALRLEEELSDVHQFLGVVHGFFTRDWARAESCFRRGVELGPSSAEAHGNYGLFLLVRGRFDEALMEGKLAQQLDPLSPTWNTWSYSGMAMSGQVGEGIAGIENVVAMHPQHWVPREALSSLYSAVSRLDDARREAEAAVTFSGGVSAALARLACVCYMQGDERRGDEVFEMLQSRARTSYAPPAFLARVHLARGEADAALARLQEAASGRDPWITFHRLTAPAADPRIDAFLKSLGM